MLVFCSHLPLWHPAADRARSLSPLCRTGTKGCEQSGEQAGSQHRISVSEHDARAVSPLQALPAIEPPSGRASPCFIGYDSFWQPPQPRHAGLAASTGLARHAGPAPSMPCSVQSNVRGFQPALQPVCCEHWGGCGQPCGIPLHSLPMCCVVSCSTAESFTALSCCEGQKGFQPVPMHCSAQPEGDRWEGAPAEAGDCLSRGARHQGRQPDCAGESCHLRS